MATCSTNYSCEPVWYTEADKTENAGEDVILPEKGPSAVDNNITCIPGTGSINFQVKDQNDVWFTPAEASFTVLEATLVRLPRANMPDMRIIANGDAVFSVAGKLS